MVIVQHRLTADNAFVEHSFHVDLLFTMFVMLMALLFIVFGIALDTGSLTPVNYETFW